MKNRPPEKVQTKQINHYFCLISYSLSCKKTSHIGYNFRQQHVMYLEGTCRFDSLYQFIEWSSYRRQIIIVNKYLRGNLDRRVQRCSFGSRALS